MADPYVTREYHPVGAIFEAAGAFLENYARFRAQRQAEERDEAFRRDQLSLQRQIAEANQAMAERQEDRLDKEQRARYNIEKWRLKQADPAVQLASWIQQNDYLRSIGQDPVSLAEFQAEIDAANREDVQAFQAEQAALDRASSLQIAGMRAGGAGPDGMELDRKDLLNYMADFLNVRADMNMMDDAQRAQHQANLRIYEDIQRRAFSGESPQDIMRDIYAPSGAGPGPYDVQPMTDDQRKESMRQEIKYLESQLNPMQRYGARSDAYRLGIGLLGTNQEKYLENLREAVAGKKPRQTKEPSETLRTGESEAFEEALRRQSAVRKPKY